MNTVLRELGSFASFVGEAGRTWFEHSDESLFVILVEPDRFVFEAINPAHERRTGLRSVEIADKTPHEVLPQSVADAVTANYRRCLEAGEIIRYDETLALPGGIRRWTTVLTPIRDGTGRIVRILGSARDVTAEHETRALMEDIIAASPDILYVFDLDEDRNLFMGGRFDEILGWSREDFVRLSGRTMSALIHPDDLPAVMEHLARVRLLPDGQIASIEYRMRRADGSYVWLRSRDRAFARGHAGRVTRLFGQASCIQRAKEAEAELRAANERLASTLSSITDCYFTLDRGYLITDVNESCLDWLGRDRGEVIGLYYWDLCQPHHECGGATKLGMDGRQAVRRELRSAMRPDRWLDFRVFPSDAGVTVYFRDITDAMEAHCEERRAKGLLQATLDSLSAHVAILDSTGTVIAVNRAWHHFAERNGYPTTDHGVGLDYVSVCRSAASGDIDARLAAEGLSTLLAGERTEFGMKYTCGDQWFLLRAARFTHEGAVHAVVAHENVTEVVAARNEVRTLSGHLLHLQDEERQRIGAELHDSTTQHLTAAGLGLARAQLLADGRPELAATLGRVGTSIDEAQREIRTLSFLLYPPGLARDGLSLTLRDYVHGFARRAGLMARVRIDPAVDAADGQVRRAALRVMQEALANLRRHARATRIAVDVRVDGGTLRLRVSDNGIGLPNTSAAGARHKLGVGIPGMQARVRQLGGELFVASGRRGSGTTVRALMPLISPTEGAALRPRDDSPEPTSGFAPMADKEPPR